MPRKNMFTREEVLACALELARERGISAVTARALGARLGTTSRPIFGLFENMAEVQRGIFDSAYKLYRQRLADAMESGEYPPYKASGMAYIRFAGEERELFKLLFMRDRTGERIDTDPEELEGLLDLICAGVGIDREEARLFHFEMWAYVHGFAAMAATGYCEWDTELVSRALTDMYEGLKYRFKNPAG